MRVRQDVVGFAVDEFAAGRVSGSRGGDRGEVEGVDGL